MADGTVMNPGSGGDTISNKEFAVAADGVPADPRGTACLPVTAYKLPRSKIAIGDYDHDNGDATSTNALPIQTFYERRMMEQQMIMDRDRNLQGCQTRGKERIDLCDRRGGHVGRGLR